MTGRVLSWTLLAILLGCSWPLEQALRAAFGVVALIWPLVLAFQVDGYCAPQLLLVLLIVPLE